MTRSAATRCVLRAYNAAGGAYSAPSDHLAGFKGAASRRGGEMDRRGGEGRLTLMRSMEQSRRLAKAGPGLSIHYPLGHQVVANVNS